MARTDRDLKRMIGSLPDGLEHTYETLLQQMVSRFPERMDDLKTLLRCLVVASPILTAANLAEVLALQPGQRTLDFDNVATDPYDVLDIIAPFVILHNDKNTYGVVKLSHYSLDEYLRSDRLLHSRFGAFHINPENGHAWMAEICLQYITLDIFTRSKYETARSEPTQLEQYSFRQYAALNWFRHYNLARNIPNLQDRCSTYLKRLFLDTEGSPCYRRWQEVLQQKYPYDELHRYSPICFAISQGLDEVVDKLLFQLGDINVPLNDGHTCLTVAAKWNQPAIIRKLLDLGADIERPGIKKCTPLHLAAEFASRDAFDLLLDAGANPHARSSTESTPFYRACRGGDEHIVKRLKECGCDINARTNDSWTPLMEAVENAHEEVLDLLLEWDVDFTIRSEQGWTVLLIAKDCDFAPRPSIIEKLRLAAPKDVYEQYLLDRELDDTSSGTEGEEG
jgi:ankyrin repeat protein